MNPLRLIFPVTLWERFLNKSSLIVFDIFELLQMYATSHPWAEITISAYICSLKYPEYFPAPLTWKAQWKMEHDPPRKRKSWDTGVPNQAPDQRATRHRWPMKVALANEGIH